MKFYLCLGTHLLTNGRFLSLESANKQSQVEILFHNRLMYCRLEQVFEIDTRYTAKISRSGHAPTFLVQEYQSVLPQGRLFYTNDCLRVNRVVSERPLYFSCTIENLEILVSEAKERGLLPPSHVYTVQWQGLPHSIATNPQLPCARVLVTKDREQSDWEYRAYVQSEPVAPPRRAYQPQFTLAS